MIVVRDALGREVGLKSSPARVVSLVPSETESVVELFGLDRLVGRTEFCEEPAEAAITPTIGGTKRCDLDAIVALAPDLVLANQEENSRHDVERLIAAGLNVHVSFPRSVADAFAYLRTLLRLFDGDERARDRVLELEDRASFFVSADPVVRVFVPIWKEPWMTFDARTYASDVLSRIGAANVFADRARRFPLAADVGDARAIDPGERDTRYPRTSLAEIEERAPELVLLPDEPYRFETSDAAEIAAPSELVSGKDLFWYGVRTAPALARLSTSLARHRGRGADPSV